MFSQFALFYLIWRKKKEESNWLAYRYIFRRKFYTVILSQIFWSHQRPPLFENWRGKILIKFWSVGFDQLVMKPLATMLNNLGFPISLTCESYFISAIQDMEATIKMTLRLREFVNRGRLLQEETCWIERKSQNIINVSIANFKFKFNFTLKFLFMFIWVFQCFNFWFLMYLFYSMIFIDCFFLNILLFIFLLWFLLKKWFLFLIWCDVATLKKNNIKISFLLLPLRLFSDKRIIIMQNASFLMLSLQRETMVPIKMRFYIIDSKKIKSVEKMILFVRKRKKSDQTDGKNVHRKKIYVYGYRWVSLTYPLFFESFLMGISGKANDIHAYGF